jgi:hypothetical protein
MRTSEPPSPRRRPERRALPSLTGLLARVRRAVGDRTTDAWVVGYPKTGNTWVRFMLGRYVQLTAGTEVQPLFDEADLFGRRARFGNLPRLSFTHAPLTWESQVAADLTAANVTRPFSSVPVVLLVRHPLDAVVSNWFQQTTRAKPRYRGTLEDFIEDPVFGLDKLLRFYELWREQRRGDRVALFRYEDARAEPTDALRSILTFLDLEADSTRLADAVSYASFDNMQRLEASGRAPVYRSSGKTVFATGDPADPDARHVRRGEIGGYRAELGGAAVPYERLIASSMSDWYGYGRTEGDH